MANNTIQYPAFHRRLLATFPPGGAVPLLAAPLRNPPTAQWITSMANMTPQLLLALPITTLANLHPLALNAIPTNVLLTLPPGRLASIPTLHLRGHPAFATSNIPPTNQALAIHPGAAFVLAPNPGLSNPIWGACDLNQLAIDLGAAGHPRQLQDPNNTALSRLLGWMAQQEDGSTSQIWYPCPDISAFIHANNFHARILAGEPFSYAGAPVMRPNMFVVADFDGPNGFRQLIGYLVQSCTGNERPTSECQHCSAGHGPFQHCIRLVAIIPDPTGANRMITVYPFGGVCGNCIFMGRGACTHRVAPTQGITHYNVPVALGPLREFRHEIIHWSSLGPQTNPAIRMQMAQAEAGIRGSYRLIQPRINNAIRGWGAPIGPAGLIPIIQPPPIQRRVTRRTTRLTLPPPLPTWPS